MQRQSTHLILAKFYKTDWVVLKGKKSIILKKDEVLLMGDNRGNSFDSWDFGPIKKEIKGKLIKRFMADTIRISFNEVNGWSLCHLL